MERDNEYFALGVDEWPVVRPEPGIKASRGALAEQQVRLWALVLDARSIPCRIEHDDNGWRLLAPEESFDLASDELRLFEEENRNWPPHVPPSHPLMENTLATLSILILLATFHNLTQLDSSLPGVISPEWRALGNAQAARILEGEWWRLVTALTLHADWLHLISNLSIGGFLVVYLCRELGSGLAWSLLLCSGILGNLLNAAVQPATHNSVGASTAVFGTVGILAAISLVRYRRHLQRRWTLPVAAALALLALLGTEGKRTDLGAHLFGFLCGVVLGLATEYLIGTYGPPGRRLNALLALLSVAVVVAAWWAALEFGG